MLSFVLYITVVKGQGSSNDLQWFVAEGKGKQGLDEPNNHYDSQQIGKNISILGVKHQGETNKRNDIFVIYDSGEHFNSRNNTNFRLEESYGVDRYDIVFSEEPIYLYYTNLYEGDDDPPPSVNLMKQTGTTIQGTNVGITGQLYPVFANHDLVLDKDVTLIVKNPITNKNTSNDNRFFKLYFNKEVLVPEPFIFRNEFVIPFNTDTYTSGEDYITLNFTNNESHKYINFRVYSYGQFQSNTQNTNILGSVDFQLTTLNENHIYTHSEFLRTSHDPNYIEVLNIFEKKPGEYWAHMHVQCYNDSREAHVDDAQLALTMPSTVDAATLEMTDWSYGMTQGALPDVTMKKSGDRIYFNFGSVPDILNMQGPDYNYVDPSQVAWVEYIVKINSNNPAEVATINLKPLKPMTFFDGTPYDITRYIDRCFGNLSDRTDLCERKIMGPYYMGQFTETMALGSPITAETYPSTGANQNCCKHQCSKDRCKNDCHKNQCKDKCCKKKKRFWRNVIPWVIAGVMTVIAIAD